MWCDSILENNAPYQYVRPYFRIWPPFAILLQRIVQMLFRRGYDIIGDLKSSTDIAEQPSWLPSLIDVMKPPFHDQKYHFVIIDEANFFA